MESETLVQKRKAGRPFLKDRNSREFYCEFCKKTLKSSGPNSYYVRRHYITKKCEFNRKKYFELNPEKEKEWEDRYLSLINHQEPF